MFYYANIAKKRRASDKLADDVVGSEETGLWDAEISFASDQSAFGEEKVNDSGIRQGTKLAFRNTPISAKGQHYPLNAYILRSKLLIFR